MGVLYTLVTTITNGRRIEKFSSNKLVKEFFFHPALNDDDAAKLIEASAKGQNEMDATLATIATAVAAKSEERICADLVKAGYEEKDAAWLATWIKSQPQRVDRMLVTKLAGIKDLVYAHQLVKKGATADIAPSYQRLILDVFRQVLEGEIDGDLNASFLETLLRNNRRGYQWTVMSMIAGNFERDPKFNTTQNMAALLHCLVDFLTFKVGNIDLGAAMQEFGKKYSSTVTVHHHRSSRVGGNYPSEEWSPNGRSNGAGAGARQVPPRRHNPARPRNDGLGQHGFDSLNPSQFPSGNEEQPQQ
jgi:hypothetical protein